MPYGNSHSQSHSNALTCLPARSASSRRRQDQTTGVSRRSPLCQICGRCGRRAWRRTEPGAAATPPSNGEDNMALDGRCLLASIMLGLVALAATPAVAQKRYDPGASDTEIKVGNIVPYSGPASAYGVNGKTVTAYFNKVNAEGGINGRNIRFISYDDGYSPPKTVEQARKLV